jgi:hypothetical protein
MSKRSTNLNRAHRSARPTPANTLSLMESIGMTEQEIRAAHARSLAARPSADLHARIIARWPATTLSDALAARGWRHEAGGYGRRRVYDDTGALLGEFDAHEAWVYLLLTETSL